MTTLAEYDEIQKDLDPEFIYRVQNDMPWVMSRVEEIRRTVILLGERAKKHPDETAQRIEQLRTLNDELMRIRAAQLAPKVKRKRWWSR